MTVLFTKLGSNTVFVGRLDRFRSWELITNVEPQKLRNIQMLRDSSTALRIMNVCMHAWTWDRLALYEKNKQFSEMIIYTKRTNISLRWSSTGLKRGRWGVSRGEFSTTLPGGFWSMSRAWSCQNEVRLGEDEVPDDPVVLRTRYSVKILVEEACWSDEIVWESLQNQIAMVIDNCH